MPLRCLLGNSEQPAGHVLGLGGRGDRSDHARTRYRPYPPGVVSAVAPLSQALLLKRQARFSIPNAHDLTKASFSSIVRSRVSVTRIKKFDFSDTN